jgi:hypothetical protein
MFRALWITILWFSFRPETFAQTQQQDYTDELIRLSQLTGDKQYRAALDGYRRLQEEPQTPEWLRAASEYEIAELYAALGNSENARTALGRAIQLGFDDCLTPRASQRLKPIVTDPKAAKALAAIKITEADFRELVWLQSEVEHAEHDARLMITENINRIDQQATDIPQAQVPARATTSVAVLYWRQQLRLMQKAQRDFVRKSDEERMAHAATSRVIAGGASQSALLESARNARVAAESRRAEIRKRAFVPVQGSPDVPKACYELK